MEHSVPNSHPQKIVSFCKIQDSFFSDLFLLKFSAHSLNKRAFFLLTTKTQHNNIISHHLELRTPTDLPSKNAGWIKVKLQQSRLLETGDFLI